MNTSPKCGVNLRQYIRDVPNFPKKGIIFKDITPLLRSPEALDFAAKKFTEYGKKRKTQIVGGIESRGFVLGSIVAHELGVGFIPFRKKGKLPYKTLSESFSLEYGKASMEVHQDAFDPSQRVLIVDDLLATGGTAMAACKLVKKLKADVAGIAVIIELEALKGKEGLKGYDILSLIKYGS